MSQDTTKIKVSASKKLTWPPSCVLCLKKATKKDAFMENEVPYCDNCYAKVERLRHWKDGLFMIAGIIGILGGIAAAVGSLIQEGINALGQAVGIFMGGSVMVFGLSYGLMWLGLLPLRLIFRSKLANPGVKTLKTKEAGVTVLKFSNPKYAKMFQENNGLSAPD